ncbi:SpoIIE family protein phosphatase [Kitasatospora sp. GP82]|uniref:ATP-binding SpoIIE family protein phosphatase n=1 Tax=Kitasatospora sp. GP82 TaxID=3035089 RepID=UPI002475934E|nr:SpoIIE family protein phosphatase [Kitasatospora sp. GP82]MDH6126545.1 serine phosphatase RsbU (regulator of sigma subunit)/PAS domain-containing protein/anti-sigma regulatory factor (Ser/Thr protein kinase) [Kitasatospora sp. GP82]
MNASSDPAGGGPSPFGDIAAVVVDGAGVVLQWSRAAAKLLDRTAAEVCGQPIRQLVEAQHPDTCGVPAAGRAVLRHRSGRKVEVAFHALRLDGSSDLLVLAAPLQRVSDREQGTAFLRALLTQDRIGIAIHDTDLNIVRTNRAPAAFGGVAATVGGRLREAVFPEEADEAEAALRRVLDTGVPLIDRELRARSQHVPGPQGALSLSAFRLEDDKGRPTGVAAVLADAAAQGRRRDLRHEASVRIGDSLDVMRTAQDLVDVLVPAFGDLAWVSVADPVLDGDEPPKLAGAGSWHLRRVAAASVGSWPAGFVPPGFADPPVPDLPVLRRVQRGETVVVADRASAIAMAEGHPELIPLLIPENGHSAVSAPLFARGLVLGAVAVWRTERPEAFDQADADLLTEIASRAALSVDNARRYTREHRAAVALQQRLLPPAATDHPAAETAGLYRPAGGGADISGDWFDVVPLPSLRVAFVIGDVVGHGLHATATMGRLRAAIHTLADLEMEPDELLTHVDDLVQQLAGEASPGHGDEVGATCLYAVYDPVTGHCTLASAGHLSPIVVRPDGTAHVIEVTPGPPLGVGGMPFEIAETDLPPGSTLALYTDGLIERADDDLDAGIRRLTDNLAALCRSERTLDDIGRSLLARTGDTPPRDDIALLIARTRAVSADNTASWELPADPAIVADARGAVARQLAAWGLEDITFTTELVVSELVTNAIRYGGAPVGLRLIRNTVLVCEVSDSSNTQPRLRRARATDEGGRGLFLVAQLATRWGCRYGRSGKTIWAEQSLTATRPPA